MIIDDNSLAESHSFIDLPLNVDVQLSMDNHEHQVSNQTDSTVYINFNQATQSTTQPTF